MLQFMSYTKNYKFNQKNFDFTSTVMIIKLNLSNTKFAKPVYGKSFKVTRIKTLYNILDLQCTACKFCSQHQTKTPQDFFISSISFYFQVKRESKLDLLPFRA